MKTFLKYHNTIEGAMLYNFMCVFILSLMAIVIKPLALIVALALMCLIATTTLCTISMMFGFVNQIKEMIKADAERVI